MRWWMGVVVSVLLAGPVQAGDGWMVGDLVGAAVIGSNGRVVGRIVDLYADREGQVRTVEVEAQGEVVQVPWPSLHPDRAGHVVRLSGGVAHRAPPPSGLVSLVRSVGVPVTFRDGVTYGRVAAVKIGGDGRVELVMVKPAVPALQVYPLAWSALDYYSLPQTVPEVAETPR